jgi:hypothetical protein
MSTERRHIAIQSIPDSLTDAWKRVRTGANLRGHQFWPERVIIDPWGRVVVHFGELAPAGSIFDSVIQNNDVLGAAEEAIREYYPEIDGILTHFGPRTWAWYSADLDLRLRKAKRDKIAA